MPQMLLHLLNSASAVHLKVRISRVLLHAPSDPFSLHVVWGVVWLIISLVFFVAGLLVGLVAFKQSAAQQKSDASHFLPVPHSGAVSTTSIPSLLAIMGLTVGSLLFGLQ